MRRSIRPATLCLTVLIAGLVGAAGQPRPAAPPVIDVTVQEGTSMSVAVSPDGRTLAIDLQGGIWTVPAGGGAARRVTGVYEDARQPVWSPPRNPQQSKVQVKALYTNIHKAFC